MRHLGARAARQLYAGARQACASGPRTVSSGSRQSFQSFAGAVAAGATATVLTASWYSLADEDKDAVAAAQNLTKELEAKGLLTRYDGAAYVAHRGSLGNVLGPHLELFVGNADGSTTNSWCSDCSRAVPVVLSCALNSNVPVVAVGCGAEMADWKLDKRGKSNPFRAGNETGLALQGLPTLRLVDADGAEVMRLDAVLEESDVVRIRCAVEAAIRNELPQSGAKPQISYGKTSVIEKDILAANEELTQMLHSRGLLTRTSSSGYKTMSRLQGPHLQMFVGNADGSTTGSWCPDCIGALPVVLGAVKSLGVPILVVGMGENANDWKKVKPFTSADGTSFGGLPTLLLINGNGEKVAQFTTELENLQLHQDIAFTRSVIEGVVRELVR